MRAVPSYEHECDPPAVDIVRPERRRWYCPDCGTGWLFGRRDMDGLLVARWFPMIIAHGEGITVGVPIAKLRQLAEKWDTESRDFYYDNRHTHPQGIGYASGYSDALEHLADELRKVIG